MKIYKLNSSKKLGSDNNQAKNQSYNSLTQGLDYDNDQDRILLYNLPAIEKGRCP